VGAGYLGRAPLRAACLALIGAALACPGAALADAGLALAVKATYLYKLAPFVDWPPAVLGAAHDPFVICVVGRDPFGALLDRAVAGQQVAGRPIVVRRAPTAPPDGPCQIMFLGGSPAQPVPAALQAEATAPVLTVTDASSTPGMVDFVLDQGRVRFRIDPAGPAPGPRHLGDPKEDGALASWSSRSLRSAFASSR
jgi:hypothetical protein